MINLSRKNVDGDRCYVSVFFYLCENKGETICFIAEKIWRNASCSQILFPIIL